MVDLQATLEEHPHWKRLSKMKLKAELKKANIKIPGKVIDAHYKNTEFHQIRIPAHTQRRPPLLITAPPWSFQMDIAHMPNFVTRSAAYFLLLVDVLSRKAYAYPMPNREMNTIIGAYTTFC